MKKSIKSNALSIAHKVKEYFTNWSDAVRASWKIAKLFAGFTVDIAFAKSTGELREATCIAMGSIETLKKGYFRFIEQVGEKTQWRSCKLERMVFLEEKTDSKGIEPLPLLVRKYAA